MAQTTRGLYPTGPEVRLWIMAVMINIFYKTSVCIKFKLVATLSVIKIKENSRKILSETPIFICQYLIHKR